MKKKVSFILLFFVFASTCFAEAKFYRTKDGYSGYAEMFYFGKKGVGIGWDCEQHDQFLFESSNKLGYIPRPVEKVSKAQWALFWAAYNDQYDVQKGEIYSVNIKVSGADRVLHLTFRDDDNDIIYYCFEDRSNFP